MVHRDPQSSSHIGFAIIPVISVSFDLAVQAYGIRVGCCGRTLIGDHVWRSNGLCYAGAGKARYW
jgi:hypothetical protein